MKRITTLVMAALMAALFTSCTDDDTQQAMALSGQWHGDFGMYYELQDRYGRWWRFDSYDTDIVFYPQYDYATYGYGKQVDFYSDGPYAYQYYYFNWVIRYGVLYLTYPTDHSLDTEIYDYRMSTSYFSGRFGSSVETFRLRKIADYYDWGRYTGDYYYGPSNGYGDFFGYYYSVRSAKDDAGDGAVNIRRGNRFSKSKDAEI